ncbi:uncharacterized protein V1516DRAFT_352943 [Lipomyces oligophaga]|uniref:uncharacterized protein n=1 Tax=Lipomyces oligophaga TaxID=45792 RepID=UPI0034CEFA8C
MARLILSLPPPRLLTLDAYGTIYTPLGSVAEQYSSLYHQHYPDRPGDQATTTNILAATFSQAFAARTKSHPNYSGGERQWWITVIKQTFDLAELPISSDFATVLYNWFNSANAYSVYQDIADFLDSIPQSTKIGVLSNSDTRSRSVLSGLGMQKWIKDIVSDVVLSSEVGIEKPSPDIFGAASRKLLSLSPSAGNSFSPGMAFSPIEQARQLQFWHVGDDFHKDIAPLISEPSLSSWGGIYICPRLPGGIVSRKHDSIVTLGHNGRVLQTCDLRNLTTLFSPTGIQIEIN